MKKQQRMAKRKANQEARRRLGKKSCLTQEGQRDDHRRHKEKDFFRE